MKRFPFMLLLVAFLLTSCGGLGAAAPTVAPPSDTPVPTDTPLPTDTPTAVPTSTPDAEATAAAQATTGASTVLDELDQLLGDSEVPYQEGRLVWQQTDPIAINLRGPSGNDTTAVIDEDLEAGDFVFKSDVTWEATGWMFCGAIVRSESDLEAGRQYQFYFLRLSGLPAWNISVWDDNRFVSDVSKEQFSAVIDQGNGETNEFVLVAQDNEFSVYFNGDYQGRYFDNSKQRSEGQFGFMAWQESGTGSCKFDNSWIWSLDQ